MQVAYFDDEPVVAFDLTREQFEQLRSTYRKQPHRLRFSDGTQAVPRAGASVGQHFSHTPGHGGDTQPETVHHITAKRLLRDLAVSRGWPVQLEARHPDGHWQADVMITYTDRTVAFEVQWSPQTVDDYLHRTTRYLSDGIDTIWLTRHRRRSWSDIAAAVNAIPYQGDGIVGTHLLFDQVTLDRGARAALYRLTHEIIPTPADAPRIMKTECRRCGRDMYYNPEGKAWGAKQPLPDNVAALVGQSAAYINSVYSRQAGTRYPAWHCRYCHAMHGDFYLRGDPHAFHDGALHPVTTTHRTFWDSLSPLMKPVE